jgi:hypothetical protein
MSWGFTANFNGVATRGVRGEGTEPTTGAYKVKIISTESYNNDSSVKFQLAIADGDFAGYECRIFIGTDVAKTGNLRSWKTALISAGYSKEQVEAGDVPVNEETFSGKDAFIYYKARDPNDANSQTERNFIVPDQFKALTGTGAIVGEKVTTNTAKVPAMNVAAPASGMPAPKANGAASLKSLLGK